MSHINDEFEQTEFLNSKEIEVSSNNNLLNSALHYASIGYPVFPLHNVILIKGEISCSCIQRQQCSNIAKHPRTWHGFRDATTHTDKLIHWWTKHPDANIGLVTGKESGIFVLDVDVKSGGKYSIEDLIDDYQTLRKEPFPATLIANTGSGGVHYYFKYLLDFGVTNSAQKIGSGLDVRGDGGYIVAPPSLHVSGNRYQWFGTNTPIDDAPDWLVYEILKSDEPIISEDLHEESNVQVKNAVKVLEGNRQTALLQLVSGLVNSHSKQDVLRRALERNREYFIPPFPDKYVTKQVDYLHKKYGKQKRQDMGLKA
jgi:putative DNA primase/helicase